MDIDKRKFKYKVVIDFIQINFKTLKNSHAFSIKRNTGFSYVQPLNKGDGSAANEFQFRLYDVTNWNQYDDCIKKLQEHCELDGIPAICGVEVSLDAYSKKMNNEDLIQHVAEFYWKLAKPLSSNRRIANHTAEGITNKRNLINQLTRGGTLYIGNQKMYKGRRSSCACSRR